MAGGRLVSQLRKVRMAAPVPLLLRVYTPPTACPSRADRSVSETHGHATLHENLARIHHEGCGGVAESGGPAAGIEGVSSHTVRWILLL